MTRQLRARFRRSFCSTKRQCALNPTLFPPVLTVCWLLRLPGGVIKTI